MRDCKRCGGPVVEVNGRPVCRACVRASSSAWAKTNRDAYNAIHKRYFRSHREVMLVSAAKQRARHAGLAFDLKAKDIVIPEVCPLLGIRLVNHAKRHGPDSPSLDRLRPAKGYVRGNVWVISYRANVMKNDASLTELELLTTNLRAKLAQSFRAASHAWFKGGCHAQG